jgi:hypothetical protein
MTEIETKMPAPQKTPAKRASRLEAFYAAAAELSDAERSEAEDRGYLTPNHGDGSDAAENWGYLCSCCGAVAIVFQGSKFRQHDGSVGETLPPGMSLNKVPWIQKVSEKFPRALISREKPICPDCRVPLNFEGGAEKYLKARLVRSLVAHRQVEAENRQAIEDHRNSRRRVPVGAPSPSQIRIPS